MSMMSMPLPPPSPFQNSNHEECNSSLYVCHDGGQGIRPTISTTVDSDQTNETLNEKHNSNEEVMNSFDNLQTKDESIIETIGLTKSSDSQMTTTTTCTTCSPIVFDDDTFNKEIEVTLQSLNDELDRLDSNEESDGKPLNHKELEKPENNLNSYAINTINRNDNCIESNTKDNTNNNTNKVSVQVKQSIDSTSDIESIKNKFESSMKKPSPPTSITTSPVSSKSESIVMNNKEKTKTQFSLSTNGKTTVIVNKSPTPRPLSPQSPPISPSPTNEDKLSITDEVRQVCRPRVRLTNFSIGSYKREVDIFEDTSKSSKSSVPMTAPVTKSGTKSFVTFPLLKKEDNLKSSVNQSKHQTKVNITATSTTTTTTSIAKPSTPVIQTLITSAPKINRMHSWSGQKTNCLEEKNIKQPKKSNERYVSQISINKDLKNLNQSTEEKLDEDLRSPQLVVQTLIAKTEEKIKNRSPSPMDLPQKMEPIKEQITISIKPGLESIIRSNSKQNNSEKTNNEINYKKNVPQKTIHQSIPKQSNSKLMNSLIQLNKTYGEESTDGSTGPPVPPPIPPPVPQNISFASETVRDC